MKKKCGFTLIELVVTIGVIGIAAAMAVITVTSLSRIQSASIKLNDQTTDLESANSLFKEYISFVSIKNDEADFSFEGCTTNSITFSNDGYNYVLSYNRGSNSLTINSDYDGEIDYFKLNKTSVFKSITNIEFSYDTGISLLVADVSINDTVTHYSYVVRV